MRTNWFNYKVTAVRLADCHGRRVYRFPVTVEYFYTANPVDCATAPIRKQYYVTAHTAADAAELIQTEYIDLGCANTTVTAYGIRGGATRRFISWDRVIGDRLFRGRRSGDPAQLKLNLGGDQ